MLAAIRHLVDSEACCEWLMPEIPLFRSYRRPRWWERNRWYGGRTEGPTALCPFSDVSASAELDRPEWRIEDGDQPRRIGEANLELGR
jgi:hypothetical protein